MQRQVKEGSILPRVLSGFRNNTRLVRPSAFETTPRFVALQSIARPKQPTFMLDPTKSILVQQIKRLRSDTGLNGLSSTLLPYFLDVNVTIWNQSRIRFCPIRNQGN
jgi:hypothetical protein